jgi:hypothetical protein
MDKVKRERERERERENRGREPSCCLGSERAKAESIYVEVIRTSFLLLLIVLILTVILTTIQFESY